MAQIELPELAERLVEALQGDLRPEIQEAPAPLLQGEGVAGAEIEAFDRHEAGPQRLAFQRRDGWETAAGEDVALDEIRAALVRFEQGAVDERVICSAAAPGLQAEKTSFSARPLWRRIMRPTTRSLDIFTCRATAARAAAASRRARASMISS